VPRAPRTTLPARPRTARGRAARGLAALAVTAAVVPIAACSPEPPAAEATSSSAVQGEGTAYPLTLDNCGTEVTFDSAPERVVTVKSSTAETMLALGLGDKIVGAAFLDGAVPGWLADDAATTAVAEPFSDEVPGTEATLELEPDLVYAGWESNVSADGIGDRETLTALGVNTYVAPAACKDPEYMPDPLTFDAVFDEITEVGTIFDANDAAADLVADQRALLDDVTSDESGLSALWYSSGTDIPYVGAGIGAPQMILDAVGLENIAAGVQDTWTSMSWEEIVDADPDVVVLVDAAWNTAGSKIEALKSNSATAELTAVREDRFLVVPFPATEAGVRNVEAAADLSRQLAELDLDE
jgi:iron complex transport system substrate-binding protein